MDIITADQALEETDEGSYDYQATVGIAGYEDMVIDVEDGGDCVNIDGIPLTIDETLILMNALTLALRAAIENN